MGACTADVIGLDWHTEMHEARRQLGWDRVLQGNMDPMLLFAPEAHSTSSLHSITSHHIILYLAFLAYLMTGLFLFMSSCISLPYTVPFQGMHAFEV